MLSSLQENRSQGLCFNCAQRFVAAQTVGPAKRHPVQSRWSRKEVIVAAAIERSGRQAGAAAQTCGRFAPGATGIPRCCAGCNRRFRLLLARGGFRLTRCGIFAAAGICANHARTCTHGAARSGLAPIIRRSPNWSPSRQAHPTSSCWPAPDQCSPPPEQCCCSHQAPPSLTPSSSLQRSSSHGTPAPTASRRGSAAAGGGGARDNRARDHGREGWPQPARLGAVPSRRAGGLSRWHGWFSSMGAAVAAAGGRAPVGGAVAAHLAGAQTRGVPATGGWEGSACLQQRRLGMVRTTLHCTALQVAFDDKAKAAYVIGGTHLAVRPACLHLRCCAVPPAC